MIGEGCEVSETKIDGYWLRMGHMAVDTLADSGTLAPESCTPEKFSALGEYFGGLFEQAHDMGMRLGEARGRFLANYKTASEVRRD
mgnify:CR=1 FL=1